MVILDNHSQADDGYMYDLWYGQNGFTEADWISTWESLATRYANKPNVIGADLKNEPHGSATWEQVLPPTGVARPRPCRQRGARKGAELARPRRGH